MRDRATVEGLIPSAKEGRNVSYEGLSPADIFLLSFCFFRHVTVSLCKPRIRETILIFEFKMRDQWHQLFNNKQTQTLDHSDQLRQVAWQFRNIFSQSPDLMWPDSSKVLVLVGYLNVFF